MDAVFIYYRQSNMSEVCPTLKGCIVWYVAT